MSWIRDVRDEIRELDVSLKKLREFGLLVGAILGGIGAWIAYQKGLGPLCLMLAGPGVLLALLGWAVPQSLRTLYKIWMGGALAIGWIVARMVLVLLYFLVVTPIGMLGRLFGARFLALDNHGKETTFWIRRKKPSAENYRKMY